MHLKVNDVSLDIWSKFNFKTNIRYVFAEEINGAQIVNSLGKITRLS